MQPEVFLIWATLAVYVTGVFVALVVGGTTERLGALICIANSLLMLAFQVTAGEKLPYFAFMAVDLAAATAFGVLAVRTPDKLWPGVAGVAQSMVIAFSATRALDFPLSERAYGAALNLSSLIVVGSLLTGALKHRWALWRAGNPPLSAVARPVAG